MANNIRFPAIHATGIQQRITAGGAFNGTLPPGDTTDAGVATSNGMYKYTAAATGGLFFWSGNEAVRVVQFHADFGAGAETASLFLVNLDEAGAPISGESMLIVSVSGQQTLSLGESHIYQLTLLKNQALKLVSSNTNAAQIAQAVGVIERRS